MCALFGRVVVSLGFLPLQLAYYAHTYVHDVHVGSGFPSFLLFLYDCLSYVVCYTHVFSCTIYMCFHVHVHIHDLCSTCYVFSWACVLRPEMGDAEFLHLVSKQWNDHCRQMVGVTITITSARTFAGHTKHMLCTFCVVMCGVCSVTDNDSKHIPLPWSYIRCP